MLYAMKDNRQYKITEDEKQKFIDNGYRIASLVKNKLVFEEAEKPEELTKEIKALEAENETLKAEKEALQAELEELKKAEEKESGKDKEPKGEGK